MYRPPLSADDISIIRLLRITRSHECDSWVVVPCDTAKEQQRAQHLPRLGGNASLSSNPSLRPATWTLNVIYALVHRNVLSTCLAAAVWIFIRSLCLCLSLFLSVCMCVWSGSPLCVYLCSRQPMFAWAYLSLFCLSASAKSVAYFDENCNIS